MLTAVKILMSFGNHTLHKTLIVFSTMLVNVDSNVDRSNGLHCDSSSFLSINLKVLE